MKKVIILIFYIFLNLNITSAYQGMIDKTVDGKQIKVIEVKLDGRHKVITAVSQNGDNLENLVDSVDGISGVNGAYFCPADYTHCNGANTSYVDSVFEGTQYFAAGGDFGARGMFGFDSMGKPLFILNSIRSKTGIQRKYNEDKIEDLQYGISNHPVLLLEGENVLGESNDLIDNKMKAVGIKNFICSTEDQKTIYMGNISNITIYEMPSFLQENFGCYHAIGLDGGGSLSMVYDGKVLRKSGRNIMDAFVVVELYNPTIKDRKLLKGLYPKIDKFIEKKPNKAKNIADKINLLLSRYDYKSRNYFILSKIQEYILDRI